MTRLARVKKLLTGFLLIFAVVVALGSPHPLIRVGAVLAVAGFLAACILVRALPRHRLRIVTSWWWLVVLAVTVAFFAASLWLGGGAVNGRAVDGRYFVVDHGRETEVPAGWFFSLAALELLAFLLVPAGFLLAAASEREADGGSEEEGG